MEDTTMDRRSGFTLGGSGAACLATSAGGEAVVDGGALGDFWPPAK
jgi:hypothetical protein